MTDGTFRTDRDDFAEFLMRNFAQGPQQVSRDPKEPALLDENDVAAFARGALLPGRRSSFLLRLASDPDLAAAVQFERSLHRPWWKQGRIVAAAGVAAAALILVTVSLASAPSDATEQAMDLLVRGEVAEATPLLERAHEAAPSRQLARLLLLARHAQGDSDPAHGLHLTSGDLMLLPLSPSEEATHSPATVRRSDQPTLAAPRGSVLSQRPPIELRPGTTPLKLTLFRFSDQRELFSTDIQPGDPASLVAVPIPFDLDREMTYGLDLRSLGNRVEALITFEVVAAQVVTDLEEIRRDLHLVVRDPNLRAAAWGTLLLRKGFYAEARACLEAVPETQRTPSAQRALAAARRRLLQ